MSSWHKQLPHVTGIGQQCVTTNVRQKATVICEVRGSRSNKRLMYEPHDLEHNALISEGVMDDKSGESMEPMEEVPLIGLGQSALQRLVH